MTSPAFRLAIKSILLTFAPCFLRGRKETWVALAHGVE